MAAKTFSSTVQAGIKTGSLVSLEHPSAKSRTRVNGNEGGMNLIIECRRGLSKVKTLASSQTGTV